MSAFQEILKLYSFSLGSKIRTYQRWYAGTPFECVEQFVPKEGNIIDLGCGWGIFSNLMALKSSKRSVYGIDLDASKIVWAQRTIRDRTNINFRVQDLKDINLPNVDAIVLYDVAHHLEESVQFKVLEECYSKLSIGGVLILKENDTVPLWKLWVSHLVEAIALGFNITLSSKILFRSRHEWEQILTNIGFKVIHSEYIKTKYGFFVPHSLFIAKKLSY
jgi:2-polyprenyl-6-hydroxyphenyl methylase/3-demethylubiquinone-9 3-methyltransferase